MLSTSLTIKFMGSFWLTARWVLVCSVLTGSATAAVLRDAAVDGYNVRIGTQTFGGLYQFTTNTLLVETSQAIRDLGSDVVKLYHGPDYYRQYRIALPSSITNLLTLARDEPSCHRVLDQPFRHFVMWAYPFGNAWPFDGYSASERASDYQEIFDLTSYLLTNYNGSGKSFYLGHWEGDWYLLPNYNTATNPTPAAIQGMIDWLNNRQKAVDDAKIVVAHTNVEVFNYTEVNRVLDATSGNTNINQRVINRVVPYVTNLDYLSYSSYDVMDASAAKLWSTLDFMQSMLPTNKASVLPGERLWIGEYGWGTLDNTAQEQNSRAYLQRLLSWSPGPRFILFWEIYNNETNRAFWLIDSNNVKVASYYLHQRFLNHARMEVARFEERTGRLPTETEFGPLVVPILNQQLPPPANLAVQNLKASLLSATAADVSGTLVQGVYGDDCGSVWVYFGRVDGSTNRGSWEQNRFVGVNTNFNPVTFTAALTNLAPGTNYFFRFYATNASGEVWAPSAVRFSTAALNPGDYGSRLKIAFTGYHGGEPLLNFPALVNLGTNLPGFSYRQFASASGGDLRFSDAGGLMSLPFEIDEWNTNGTSSVWVRVPAISGTNACIWGYWGNPLAASLPASSLDGSVWSGDHLLVYHLREGGFPFADSAGLHPALTGIAPASVAGRVGRGCRFNGTSQYLNSGPISLGDAFTLSAWVKLNLGATDIQTIWANKSGGYNSAGFALFVNSYLTADQRLSLETGNGTSGANASTGIGALSSGQWHQITATIERAGGTAGLYVDGNDVTQATNIRSDLANQSVVNLGRFTNGAFYLNGTLDEVRIEKVTRAADWVWASWMTTASNSALASYSSVTQQPPALSLLLNDAAAILTWPASAVGFALYTVTNLALPATWTLVPNRPSLVNTQWQLSLPTDAGDTHFYQLRTPP